MTKWIDDYEYKVRGLENFINILDIPWKNYKADSINFTISLTGYLTFQKNYNVKIN